MTPERETDQALAALQRVATDAEAQLIEDLAVKAGLWWKCECGFAMGAHEQRCNGCGKDRP